MRTARAIVTLMLTASLAVVGCDKDEPITSDPPPAAGGADAFIAHDATANKDAKAEIDAAEQACPTDLTGPAMVAIPAPNGERYCIDSAEVTQGQYHEFLKAKGANPVTGEPGDIDGQSGMCDRNKLYFPPLDLPENEFCSYWVTAFDPFNRHGDARVACVDWCDATAYCQWAGKRLCGAMGGGRIDTVEGEEESEFKNAAVSEWFNACSQGGTTAYPYGDTYEPGVCGDTAWAEQHDASLEEEMASPPPTCHGTKAPFDQLVSMSGSAREWVNECEYREDVNAGGVDTLVCLARGGAFDDSPEDRRLRCDAWMPRTMSRMEPGTGFRCCLSL